MRKIGYVGVQKRKIYAGTAELRNCGTAELRNCGIMQDMILRVKPLSHFFIEPEI